MVFVKSVKKKYYYTYKLFTKAKKKDEIQFKQLYLFITLIISIKCY